MTMKHVLYGVAILAVGYIVGRKHASSMQAATVAAQATDAPAGFYTWNGGAS